MNRLQLDHIIRAAGDISDDDEIIVLGSMAIYPSFQMFQQIFFIQ